MSGKIKQINLSKKFKMQKFSILARAEKNMLQKNEKSKIYNLKNLLEMVKDFSVGFNLLGNF